MLRGKKHVDPALCLYYGAKFICVMDNSSLSEKVPRGNGTMCRFRSVKVKDGATSLRTRIFHGKKVTTINAMDVDYMECEVMDHSSHIKKMTKELRSLLLTPHRNKERIKQLQNKIQSERDKKVFRLEPITSRTTVKCAISRDTPPLTFNTVMTQFPINLADAVTGHKLQGRTLEKIIITGWGLSCWRNWEYTVLSRVKSRKGLFMLEELDLDKSYGATQQFRDFIDRMRKIETSTMATIYNHID